MPLDGIRIVVIADLLTLAWLKFLRRYIAIAIRCPLMPMTREILFRGARIEQNCLRGVGANTVLDSYQKHFCQQSLTGTFLHLHSDPPCPLRSRRRSLTIRHLSNKRTSIHLPTTPYIRKQNIWRTSRRTAFLAQLPPATQVSQPRRADDSEADTGPRWTRSINGIFHGTSTRRRDAIIIACQG